jgi:hypothetical protein
MHYVLPVKRFFRPTCQKAKLSRRAKQKKRKQQLLIEAAEETSAAAAATEAESTKQQKGQSVARQKRAPPFESQNLPAKQNRKSKATSG